MSSSSYSFLDVIATFVGPTGAFPLNSGIEAGGITITMTADKNTMAIGANGDVQHSLHADNSAQITVKLLKTSPTNALLSAMYNLQKLSAKTWGQNVININSAIGDDVIATSVAFKRQPTIVYDKEGPMNEWQFDVGTVTEILAASII